MDLSALREQLAVLEAGIDRCAATLVLPEEWANGRSYDFVELLRQLRELAGREPNGVGAQSELLMKACDRLAAETAAHFEKLKDEYIGAEKCVAALRASVHQLKRERDRAALADEKEQQHARLVAACDTLRQELSAIQQLRSRCDEIGRSAQRSGNSDDVQMFHDLVAELGNCHGREKIARLELESLEAEVSKMELPSSVPKFDHLQLEEAQAALEGKETKHNELQRLLGFANRDAIELASIRGALADLSRRASEISHRVSAVSDTYSGLSREAFDALRDRKVTRFVHFTAVANLSSIMTNGLRPRTELEEGHLDFLSTDEKRIDGLRNTISLSIEFPNYRMLYPVMLRKSAYAILEIELNVMQIADALFHRTNASSLSAYRDASIEDFLGKRGVTIAFCGGLENDEVVRAERKIPSSYPIDPQAEVLFCSIIPPTYIRRIVVRDQPTAVLAAVQLSRAKVRPRVDVEPAMFAPRADWEHWSQKSEKGDG